MCTSPAVSVHECEAFVFKALSLMEMNPNYKCMSLINISYMNFIQMLALVYNSYLQIEVRWGMI